MYHRHECKMQNSKIPRGNIGENLDNLGFGNDKFILRKKISWIHQHFFESALQKTEEK